jgi:hypothetical protein
MALLDFRYCRDRFVGEAHPANLTTFEGFLFPPFQAILQNDIQGKYKDL